MADQTSTRPDRVCVTEAEKSVLEARIIRLEYQVDQLVGFLARLVDIVDPIARQHDRSIRNLSVVEGGGALDAEREDGESP